MTTDQNRDSQFDLDELLHPAQAFGHPNDVVSDADLTINEKRAILASWASRWASDAAAVEAAPALRIRPGASRPVSADEILKALRALDELASAAARASMGDRNRRQARRRSIEGFRQRRGTSGTDRGPPQ
jgi:hypothetical protein